MPALTDPPALPPGLPAGCAVVSVRVPDARSLSAAALTDATRGAYDALRHRAATAGLPHWLRVWNYVPALLSGTPDGGNRYMAFNAGRYAAMRDWFGDDLAVRAPAATGVGTADDDLVLHAIAAAAPGVSVQNPGQTPSTRYSARYGPRPPCFARATRVGGVLLVSGTAGIAGEDTAAPDDLARQLALTLQHLATLAGGMGSYRSLRAYVPRAEDADGVAAALADAAPQAGRVVPFVVDLCRPELRVEIEGVAVDSEGR